jgi:Fur family ferric uptake transcriptional regulator
VTDNGRPHRHTRHREEVRTALQETTEFHSAQRLHAVLRDRGIPIGLSTVYRILQSFAEEGTVDSVRNLAGAQVYRLCSPSRHHHLMCRFCARTVEVEGPAIERWATAVAERHGFLDVNHSVEIFGTCASCATETAKPHPGREGN